jgi:hypothetical protein
MRFRSFSAALVFVTALGCSSPAGDMDATDGGDAATEVGPADTSFPSDGEAETTTTTTSLCAKYGGVDAVRILVGHAADALGADCRINPFFAALTPAQGQHLEDCLKTQIANALGCDGVKYAGSTDTAGVACRSMSDAHKGLGVTTADFDAYVETVLSSLILDGIAAEDLVPISAFLNGTSAVIVENPSVNYSKYGCDGGVSAPDAVTSIDAAKGKGGYY